jgi:NADH-quinone oxidoreductase subunit C
MELLHGCITGESRGQTTVFPTVDQYVPLVKALADDGYAMCVDLTATDYLTYPDRLLPEGVERKRFEVVVNLLSLDHPSRVRIRLLLDDGEPAPSLFDVHPGTEAMEREVYDMFGIEFTGHPDLTRVLMPEDWDGFPLRKDYPTGSIPVQFKNDRTRATEPLR